MLGDWGFWGAFGSAGLVCVGSAVVGFAVVGFAGASGVSVFGSGGYISDAAGYSSGGRTDSWVSRTVSSPMKRK